ncbi:hypothetical protein [Paenibacillus montanisoli]|uniref:Uncharacterized protein n=1 Tax=Paenibacillus montanisoli TaxID=2081970 RepID=A0A328U0S2_9BACL|nr:hypothetical protein [Paenibacillus montanisoli]RAP76417.1 hypothetical protein DL346_13585 [Paenibacillus montanisoli]
MSRVKKFGSRKYVGAQAARARSETAAASEDAPLTSRRFKHPSNKQQMANLFYLVLIFLFLLLMVGLLLWGKQFE